MTINIVRVKSTFELNKKRIDRQMKIKWQIFQNTSTSIFKLIFELNLFKRGD